MTPGQYLECHLLLAVMNGDDKAADALLAQFTQAGRTTLLDHLRRMREGLLEGGFAVRPAVAVPKAATRA